MKKLVSEATVEAEVSSRIYIEAGVSCRSWQHLMFYLLHQNWEQPRIERSRPLFCTIMGSFRSLTKFALWRACNLTTFRHSSTGPVVHPFASRHEGSRFNPQEGYLIETEILPLALSHYKLVTEKFFCRAQNEERTVGDHSLKVDLSLDTTYDPS